MRPAATALGTGVLVGVAAGVLWAASRRQTRVSDAGIFDWDRVAAIALRTLPDARRLDPQERATSEGTYSRILRDISEPLAAYTGVQLALADIEVQALDRQDWVHTNIGNFRDLLQPFDDLYQDDWVGVDHKHHPTDAGPHRRSYGRRARGCYRNWKRAHGMFRGISVVSTD